MVICGQRCEALTALMEMKISTASIPRPIIMARTPFIFSPTIRLRDNWVRAKSLHPTQTLGATSYKP